MCLWVGLLVVMCWMFLWEQGRCELVKVKLIVLLVIGVWRLSVVTRHSSNMEEIHNAQFSERESPMMPEKGRHLNSLGEKCPTLKPIFVCAIHKQVADPQNSCHGYKTMNKGQCSSWKSISFTSSVDSIRTAFWPLFSFSSFDVTSWRKIPLNQRDVEFSLKLQASHWCAVISPRRAKVVTLSFPCECSAGSARQSALYGPLQITESEPHVGPEPLITRWQTSAADGHSVSRGLTSKKVKLLLLSHPVPAGLLRQRCPYEPK